MILTFNQNTYRHLLVEVVLVAIETEEDYELVFKLVEQLTFKKSRTTEEQALHKLNVLPKEC